MPAFLITWRPAGEIEGRGWPESNIRKMVKKLTETGSVTQRWPFWAYRMAREGNRVFLVRQGLRGHALFGYGRILKIPNPYKGSVNVSFDALTVPSVDVLATEDELHKISRARMVWGARGSGKPLSDGVAAALEKLVVDRKSIPPGLLADSRLSRKGRMSTTDAPDDSIDDLPGLDFGAIGSDGADRVQKVTSGVKRDPKVRKVVVRRSKGQCEREGCGTRKAYSGFLDVHHILGAEKSDRVWNCVAICPNCHREAHAAPERDEINAKLLTFATKYKPRGSA